MPTIVSTHCRSLGESPCRIVAAGGWLVAVNWFDCKDVMEKISLNIFNSGSLETHASIYICAKSTNVPIQTINCSFQLKWLLVAAKHQQLIPYHTNYDYRGKLSINKELFICDSLNNTMLWPQKNSTIVQCLFTFMHLADAFIQSDLKCIQDIIFFISMCVPWELNPQPFALLTQCSTTEPQEHLYPVFVS